MCFALAYVNRGGLEVDSVDTKTSWLALIGEAYAQPQIPQIESFKQRPDSTRHEFKFDLAIRNTSQAPLNVTNIVVTFDPDDAGFLSGVLEVSNTYAVLLNADGSGTVDSKAGDAAVHAWYPNEDGSMLVVDTPLKQTLAPLTADRFVVVIRFPEDFAFRGPMRSAMLTLTWNGDQKSEMRVTLTQ